jgi:pimeloyl-ACP methyl ester carboxylesterase
VQATIILIHGATLNGASWAPVRRHLEPRWRVLAPDLPGHGSRRGERFTLEGAVETVAAAVREAAPAPVILAGDSLGGYTAQAAAAFLPQDRLKGLVLGGASSDFHGVKLWPHVLKAWMFRAMFAVTDERKLVAKKMPGLLRGEFGMNEEDAQATLDAGVCLSVFPQALSALHGVDFRGRLEKITQPTVFVNGDRDRFCVRSEAAYVAAARDAEVHRFLDCEHGVSMRRSVAYAGLVDRLAQRVFVEP